MNERVSPRDYILLIDEFSVLLHESAEFHAKRLTSRQPNPTLPRNTAVVSILRDGLQLLQQLRRRVISTRDRAVVTFVGLSNVGKSTLLNALLGGDIAPRRNGPCTAAPVEFMFGADLHVKAIYRDQLIRPSWMLNTIPQLHDKLAQLATDEAADEGKRVAKVIVEMPCELLAGGLVIADTPGFNAAQTGDAKGEHEQALKSYLLTEVTKVFWVVLAEQGIGKAEREMYQTALAQVCDDVIVTGSEDWDSDERRRFRQRFAKFVGGGHAGGKNPTFHFVSGLKGLEARTSGDVQALEAAGIPALEQRIRQLAAEPGRLAAAETSLLQLADDLNYWLSQMRDEHGTPLSPWWRPDSLMRWSSLRSPLAIHPAITTLLRERRPSH